MNWLHANAVVLLTVVVVAYLSFALVRAIVIGSRRQERPSPTEDFSRAEKVKQQVRRTIAERKANPAAATEALPPSKRAPNASRSLPPIDPFGGRGRGWWRRLWQRLRARGDSGPR